MPDNDPYRRPSDPAIKWFAGVGVLGMMGSVLFLMYLVSEMRNVGNSGAFGLFVVGLGFCGAIASVALGPIGKAIGKRILDPGAQASDALHGDLDDLRLQTEDLRQALTEATERLDFAERMLAGPRDATREELH